MSDADNSKPRVTVSREQLKKLRHDLRTPINQIIGYNELVQEVAEDEGYSAIDTDLNRVNQAARNLLDHLESCMTELLAVPGGERIDQALVADRDHDRSQDGVTPAPSATDAGTHAAREQHILVVDDVEMNRDMLSRRLKRQGYTVTTAADGHEALEKISAGHFDAVLLDIMMPGISGMEVLQTLRTSHDMNSLPIIMATAQNASEDIVKALAMGANDYVTKPIDFPVVLARLQTHLNLKAAAEEIRELAADLERGKQFIRSVFGRYLSDEVVNNLLDKPAGLTIGGESREITVLMSDLRGFSAMCENLSPEEVVRLLNLYLERMTEIILRHGGTIDEFIGDAILVVFGAPKDLEPHAECAVACALEMQLAMEAVNDTNANAGLPGIEMGIGINTGPVVVGNIGSEQRAKYGVIGRTVNLAARIESYTVGGQVLISDETASRVKAELSLNGSSTVSPKGCRGTLQIHSVAAIGGQHRLELRPSAQSLKPVRQEASLFLGILDGVNVPQLDLAGRVLAASNREAEIQLAGADLPLLSNVAVELDDPAPNGRIYAKIISVDPDNARRGVLRFSSIPDDLRNWLSQQSA